MNELKMTIEQNKTMKKATNPNNYPIKYPQTPTYGYLIQAYYLCALL